MLDFFFKVLGFDEHEQSTDSLADSALKRVKYRIAQAQKDSTSSSLTDPPNSLLCPISQALIKTPLVTPSGYIYEKSNIIKWLSNKSNPRDPLTNCPLAIAELKPIPEFQKALTTYTDRLTNFQKIKKNIMQEARAQHYSQGADYPEIFLDPIVKKPIDSAVITESGIVYDKKTVIPDSKDTKPSDKTTYKFSSLSSQIKRYQQEKDRFIRHNLMGRPTI